MPKEHAHKLKRHRNKNGTLTYFCILEDCNKKFNPAFTLGKKTICWICGNEFNMNEYSLRLAKPHCEKCHKPKNEKLEFVPQFATPVIEPSSLDLENELNSLVKEAEEGEDI